VAFSSRLGHTRNIEWRDERLQSAETKKRSTTMETENTAPTNAAASETVVFTFDEMSVLEQLRARYARECDEFTSEEKARLEFLRWLYQSGRMVA
jgi:hypothetical protein